MSGIKNAEGFTLLELLLALVILGAIIFTWVYSVDHYHVSSTTKPYPTISGINEPASSFNYGFDFSDQEPDAVTQDRYDARNVASAVDSARNVLAKFSGSFIDQSLYGFGADIDPEPTPGQYNLSAIASRISLITEASGIPVMTLDTAPAWMHPSTSAFDAPPDPKYYSDYAALCAEIAKSFPQIKYFVVWDDMTGFSQYDQSNDGAADYTDMYNDIYKAIKAVQPEDEVGGPYANLTARSTPYSLTTSSTLHGLWGYINQSAQNAITYWLANKDGADFIAIDGASEIASSNNADVNTPTTASSQYAAVDQWLKSKTKLPIWWMASAIEPSSGWSEQEGAVARIATLILMNSSGASVGMQWQPQDQYVSVDGQQAWPDEGLWTSVQSSSGGQLTILGNELAKYLSLIKQPLDILSGEPGGTLVAKTANNNFLLVNTNDLSETVSFASRFQTLTPYEVTAN